MRACIDLASISWSEMVFEPVQVLGLPWHSGQMPLLPLDGHPFVLFPWSLVEADLTPRLSGCEAAPYNPGTTVRASRTDALSSRFRSSMGHSIVGLSVCACLCRHTEAASLRTKAVKQETTKRVSSHDVVWMPEASAHPGLPSM